MDAILQTPLPVLDHRNSKVSSVLQSPESKGLSPHLRHKQTRELPWMNDWHNPPWAKQELSSRRLKDGDPPLQKDGSRTGVPKMHQELQDCTDLFNLIKACCKQKDLHHGHIIHADILARGLFEKDVSLGNALLTMYVKCGALAEAQGVFDELPARNVVTWNSLIAGYAQHGLGNEALRFFDRMQDEGLSPNAVTFICILKACGSIGAVEKGEEIHAEVGRQGLLEKDNVLLGTALVDMYGKCGELAKAQGVFDKLPARDVVMWNALIAGYAQHGLGDEALMCFRRMQDERLSPNAVTFISTLKGCSSIGASEMGEEIHAEINRQGLLEKDIVLGTALVDMFAKCGALGKAQGVFDKLPARNVVTWNALIAGYAQHGLGKEAMRCFRQMQDEGLSPNAVTFLCALKACGSIAAAEMGEKVHAMVGRQGLLEKDVLIGNALVDMYAKCGAFTKAHRVCDKLPARNLITWNALISGYAQHGLADEALSFFGWMQNEGFSPDAVTFTCILKACASIGAAKKGEEIHDKVRRMGLLGKDIVLGNALVDMYAKCGELSQAQRVFDKLPERNLATWTALIAGYAQLGKAEAVFNSFIKMIRERLEPNVVTFVVLLTACSHAGLLEEGQKYFDIMSTVYCIFPTLEHHTCMVDILSRAGQFDKAICMIEKVPASDRLLLWSALMGSCRKWINVELARWAFEHVVRLDEEFSAAYICMSNTYAAAGMHDEAVEVEALRSKNGAWKLPGRCWSTDVSGKLYSFTVGDKSHPLSPCIYAKLEDIGRKLQQEGYSPHLHWMSQAISDDKREDVLCGHNEKLAIACALINTSEGTPIRVMKNMRVCVNCHFAMLFISKIEKRRIQVTDANGFHIFEDGKCMCG